jgi:hypothetical protein
VGFAGPVLNPQTERTGDGPLLIVMDTSWASARDWSDRTERVGALLDEAGRAARPVALVALTDLPAGDPAFQSASAWSTRLPSIVPAPFAADYAAATEWVEGSIRGPRCSGSPTVSPIMGRDALLGAFRTSDRSRFSRAGGT